MTVQRIETEFAGRALTIETGRLAKQAAGSALVQFGDTVVLAAVTVSPNISSLPFFPLTVEYREKTYAAGKIPGGFLKREGRPSDKEILACRLIDRSIRPLFPEGFKNEVQVFVTVLSADQENDADVLAALATSTALSLSPVPWNGPLAAVRVGRVEGQWILNPTFPQLEFSTIDIVVSGSADAIFMVEGGALEISEQELLDALKVAQKGIRDLVAVQKKVLDKASKPKMKWTKPEPDATVVARVRALAEASMAKMINAKDKAGRSAAVKELRRSVAEQLVAEFPDKGKDISSELEEIEYRTMRSQVLTKGERVDGRDTDTIRPISIDAGLLPRVHGSALFQRGETQALVAVTLGTSDDEQRIDSIDSTVETKKSFMLHYNFPPFSTGEVKMMRGTSRREVGHGMLAERALQALLPDHTDFPYTLRIVSEILESNGSSSMASVCGGSLALMDAGVPMKAACAGVAMGLIMEGDKIAVLTDILGSEDALGDMDFKVAGTEQGITAIQMDIKIAGLTIEIMTDALEKARKGRLHILKEMAKVPAGAARRAVEVCAAHLHAADQAGQDRRPDRAEGQDDPWHPGSHGRQDLRRGYGYRHHCRRWRRGGRPGQGDGHGHHRGARGRQDLRGTGQEHHAVRRVRGDHPGRRGPAPHQRAAAWPRGEDRGCGQEGRHHQGEVARGR